MNLFAAGILMATMPAHAQSNLLAPGDDPASPVHWETWSGGEMTANAWFTYGGISYAFNGALAPGWRVRGATGYGEYTYDSIRQVDGKQVNVQFNGQSFLAEALVGHQWRIGEATIKAFAGYQYLEQIVLPLDTQNTVQGRRNGVKAVLETWLNIGPAMWLSLDGQYSTAFNSYSAQARIGHQIGWNFDAGLELGAFGNSELHAGRAGGFLRHKSSIGEILLSGGLSGDYEDPDTLYGSLSMLQRF